MALRRGIEKAVIVIIGTRDKDGKWTEGGALGNLSKPVDEDSVAPVGAISANSTRRFAKSRWSDEDGRQEASSPSKIRRQAIRFWRLWKVCSLIVAT